MGRATISLLPDPARVARFGVDQFALTFASIECHYFVHGGFLERDGQLLEEAGRLSGIPGIIVHGRYDVHAGGQCVGPETGLPEVELRIVDDAGHHDRARHDPRAGDRDRRLRSQIVLQ